MLVIGDTEKLEDYNHPYCKCFIWYQPKGGIAVNNIYMIDWYTEYFIKL